MVEPNIAKRHASPDKIRPEMANFFFQNDASHNFFRKVMTRRRMEVEQNTKKSFLSGPHEFYADAPVRLTKLSEVSFHYKTTSEI